MADPKDIQIGDRVRNESDEYGPSGAEGTVVMMIGAQLDPIIGVQYDKKFSGAHDCSGQAPNFPIYKMGHCWWNNAQDLVVLGKGEEVRPLFYRVAGGHKSLDMTPVTNF